MMRPAQKVRRLLTFCVVEVEEAHVDDIAAAESFSMAEREIATEGGEQGLPIVRTGSAALLKFDDVMADLPIGGSEMGVDGPMRAELAVAVSLRNPRQETLVGGVSGECDVAHVF